MAEIRPFRASRFTAEAGPLSRLIAPASETITPEVRDRLAADPYNVVHATLPAGESDDRSKYVRYARASAHLSGLKRGRLLATDHVPAMYRLTIRTGEDGEIQRALFALAPIREIVTTGEPVAVKGRDDRLRLLEATRTAFEPVPVLTRSRDFAERLADVPAEELARGEVEGREVGAGTTFALETVLDPDALATLSSALRGDGGGGSLVAIGSGTAIEAAASFRTAQGEKDGPVAADYVLVAIVTAPLEIPSGLVIWSLGDFS